MYGQNFLNHVTWCVLTILQVDIGLPKGEEKEVGERDDVKKEIEKLNSDRDDISKLIQLRTNWIDEICTLQKTIDRENKLKQVKQNHILFIYFYLIYRNLSDYYI